MPIGVYRVDIDCPAYDVNSHQALLYDVSHSTNLLIGTTAQSNTSYNGFSLSSIHNRTITLTEPTTLEIRHRCAATKSSNGFSINCGDYFPVDYEVYTTASFEKIG